MQLFLSTTFYGGLKSDIEDVLPLLDVFNIDGIVAPKHRIFNE